MTRTIAFLIFPDFQILDATGPIGAFEMPTRWVTPSPYRLKVIAREPGPVRSSSGVSLAAEALGDPAAIDTLVVSGGWGTRDAIRDEVLLGFIREAAKTARRVCSVCSGSFILAETGLLKGRRCTTHWRRGKQLARLHPETEVDADRIFVRDGNIWTSAGITAGIDLSLALIADDLGEDIARRAAQELVVYHRRPGGQSQFSALLEMERPDGRFSTLLSWMRENLDKALTVEELAEQARMSPRNFARAFAAETGVTPAKAVERLRLEAARSRVEASEDAMEEVARRTGFGDPERMRRAFIRAFNQPPQALRRQARAA